MASVGSDSTPEKPNSREQRMLRRSTSAVKPSLKRMTPKSLGLGRNKRHKDPQPTSKKQLEAPVISDKEIIDKKKPFVDNAEFIKLDAHPVDDPAPSADTNQTARSADFDTSGVNVLIVENSDGTYSCATCKDKNFRSKPIALLHQRLLHSTSADSAFRLGAIGRRTVNTFEKLEKQPFDQIDGVVRLAMSSSSIVIMFVFARQVIF